MSTLVFDIETVPDTDTGRQLYDMHGLSDADVAQAMYALQRQKKGHEFLPHHLQRIVAISVVFHDQDKLKVWSLGGEASSESELVERFFRGIDRYSPTLVSWNGGGFDLPVLHYRALKYGIEAARYWETGQEDTAFRYNNYISRYHARHTDLMDVIALYTGRANAPLDQISTLLGYPGKMGMSGAKVWTTFLAGELKSIRDYCETDVLNTFLVYLNYQRMRGSLSATAFEAEKERLRTWLAEQAAAHLQQFLQAWNGIAKNDSES